MKSLKGTYTKERFEKAVINAGGNPENYDFRVYDALDNIVLFLAFLASISHYFGHIEFSILFDLPEQFGIELNRESMLNKIMSSFAYFIIIASIAQLIRSYPRNKVLKKLNIKMSDESDSE